MKNISDETSLYFNSVSAVFCDDVFNSISDVSWQYVCVTMWLCFVALLVMLRGCILSQYSGELYNSGGFYSVQWWPSFSAVFALQRLG